jgi:archaellum component FlaC
MRSAVRRGVELLSRLESSTSRSRGQAIESSSKSAPEHIEDIDKIPKNVAQLKSVISELTQNVIMIAIWQLVANTIQGLPEGFDQKWIEAAKKYIQQAKGKVEVREEYLKGLLSGIEALAAENFQEEFLNSEIDKN